MAKILVVGAGLTGAVAAWRLRNSLGPGAIIECWEYLNDLGGRLCITGEQGIVADVATQYLSLDLQQTGVEQLHNTLLSAGLLNEVDEDVLASTRERPSGPQWKHFFVPSGTASVVKFLLKLANADLKTNCCLDLCSLDAEKWQWYVEAGGGKGGGSRRAESFDAVVLCNGPTHPGCERMENIWGEWQDIVSASFWKALRGVTWSSCYVITLFLKAECKEHCHRFFGENEKNIQKQIDDDLVHYISYESRKRASRSGKSGSLVVLVCHTTAEAMWTYRRSECVQAVQDRVLANYLKLPSPMASRVVRRAHSRCWGKSQVTRSISEVIGTPTTHIACNPTDAPPLALCGDYFLGSTCTDAIVSAMSGADAIACSCGGDRAMLQEAFSVDAHPRKASYWQEQDVKHWHQEEDARDWIPRSSAREAKDKRVCTARRWSRKQAA